MDDALIVLFLCSPAMLLLGPMLWSRLLKRFDLSARQRTAGVLALSIATILAAIAVPWVLGAAWHGTLSSLTDPRLWPGVSVLLFLAVAAQTWFALWLPHAPDRSSIH